MFQFDEENGAITDVNREISCGSPVCLVGVPEP
jgi:6-phosphogluconolactonase